MKKNKLIKIIITITAIVVIGCIIYYIINKDWLDAIGLTAIFLGIWVLPNFYKGIYKI